MCLFELAFSKKFKHAYFQIQFKFYWRDALSDFIMNLAMLVPIFTLGLTIITTLCCCDNPSLDFVTNCYFIRSEGQLCWLPQHHPHINSVTRLRILIRRNEDLCYLKQIHYDYY